METSDEVRLEPDRYAAFAIRIIRSLGRRVGGHDPWQLTHLVRVRDALDLAIAAAVREQHAEGYSWADIARPLGITRQNAQQVYGRTAAEKKRQTDRKVAR